MEKKVYRIKLSARTRFEMDGKIKGKIAEGYTLVNRGELHRYYGTTYFAVVEKEA